MYLGYILKATYGIKKGWMGNNVKLWQPIKFQQGHYPNIHALVLCNAKDGTGLGDGI